MKFGGRMKILIVTGIFPPDIGGPASYVPQIATALVERNHEVVLVTLSDRLDHDDSGYPFRVIRLPRLLWKPWRWWRTVWTLIHLAHHADVLFVNGLAIEATLANLALQKPMVQKVVGDLAWERATGWRWTKDNFEDFQRKRYDLRIEFLKVLRTWWIRRAKKVIVPSRYLARWVARLGVPAEKIVVIYNAVKIPNDIRPTEVPLQTPIKVVTVGRLIALKRVDRIMKAVARLDGVGLVIIGDGPERASLEKLSQELGVAKRVYFAGQKSREETLSLMAGCDLFILNSTHEGLPHVVVEAMSIGLPVIATDVGGTSEVVEHRKNGILIPPDDENALRDALQELIHNPELRRELALQGQKVIQERFGLERMIEKTEEVLYQVVK